MMPGTVLAERYRLDVAHARGGMGLVFRATDLVTATDCAVKIVAERRGSSNARRFSRETRALRDIRHPAVVRYLDSGVFHDGKDETPFLVMDWVEGENLHERLQRASLGLRESLSVLHRLVGALAAVHGRGIVHRDIKPQNLMLPDGGVEGICIVDFGIARVAEATSRGSHITGSELRLGTPGYMAPEQILTARAVDGRADVFSLGCVVFELLTGRRAFPGDDAMSILARVVIDDAPRLRALCPDLPQPIDDLLASMLSRDVNGRPAAGPALLLRVEALQRRFEGVALVPPRSASGSAPATAAESEAAEPSHATDAEPAPSLEWSSGTSVPLVGRLVELDALEASIAMGRSVAVSGPIGVGKSSLLLELVARIQHRHTVAFVDLRNAHDIASVMHGIAYRLGLQRIDASFSQLFAFFDEHPRGVLVLDGVDAVVEELGPIVEQWCAVRSFAILVASRDCPSWAGTSLAVPPLTTRRAGSAVPDAALLLATRVHAIGAKLSQNDEAALPALAERLEGNPLAIELAAAQVAAIGADEVLSRLDRSSSAGAGRVRSGFRRTMERALEVAWAELSIEDQRALTRLSFFDGDVTVAELGLLLGSSQPRVIVDRLRGLSLLTGKDERDVALSGAVRDFVRAGRAEDVAGALTHARWVVEHCEPLASRLEHVHDPAAVEGLDIRAKDLLAVASRDDLFAARAVRALDPVIGGRVPAGAHLDLLTRAVAISVDAGSTSLAAELTRVRGRVLALMGHFAEATREITSSLAFAEGTGRIALAAACLMELGVVCHMTGDVVRGAEWFHRVLDLRGELLSPRIEARAIGNLGGLLHDAGRLTEAYRHYVEAIALAESSGDFRMLGVFMTNLAVLDADRGQPVSALLRLRRAVAALDHEGERRLLAMALGNLGMVELELGHLANARTNLMRAARILGAVGDARSESIARARLALVHARLGDVDAAKTSFARGRDLARADANTSVTVRAFGVCLHACLGELTRTDARHELEVLRRSDGRLLLSASDDARAALRVLDLSETVEAMGSRG